jgi:hypothetical protein
VIEPLVAFSRLAFLLFSAIIVRIQVYMQFRRRHDETARWLWHISNSEAMIMWQIRFIVFTAALASSLIATSPLHAQVDVQDSLALVALYNSTNGAQWKSHENWFTGPVSTWEGITVTDGRVEHVVLPENNLSGPLPPEIGALTKCTRFEFSTNAISGNIPVEVGYLTRLTSLDLGRNNITGSIPSSIGNLTNLQRLNLNGNELSGSIPSTIGGMDSLRTLVLSVNQLSGPIPNSLFSLVKLQDLHLNQNRLEGELLSLIHI